MESADLPFTADEIEIIKELNLTAAQVEFVRSVEIPFEVYKKIVRASDSARGQPFSHSLVSCCYSIMTPSPI